MKGKRSPNYPFINLEFAINRAIQLKEKEGFNAVQALVAVSHWRYGPKSSGGIQTIAALKSYGLISDSGSGKSRKIHLTELARRILLDTRAVSSERDQAIKDAALNPKLFLELWSSCTESGMPSDENMIHTLVFERNFNESTARDVVKKFKETMEFAKINLSDTMSNYDNEHIVENENIQHEMKSSVQLIPSVTKSPTTSMSTVIGQQIGSSIPVTSVCSMSIFAVGTVTQPAITKLIDYLELIKGSFPENAAISEEENKA